MQKAVGVKKIGAISLLVVGFVWRAQAMEPGLENSGQHNSEEKGSPEIELLISAAGDQQPGTDWSSIHEFLSDADKKELRRNHTDQELDEVFKTFIKPEDPAGCMQNFLLALIKHDTARKDIALKKNYAGYGLDNVCIKSFVRHFSLGVIGIVIVLCGPFRLQCGN